MGNVRLTEYLREDLSRLIDHDEGDIAASINTSYKIYYPRIESVTCTE